MKTDSIFYELFANLPETFFALLNLPENLAQEYQFCSQELKQLAKRIDGIFLPETNTKPIYFVEVQFQPDENFYHRLFTEIFVYLGQYKPSQDFHAVAIWANKNLNYDLPIYYQCFQSLGKLNIIYLDELNLTSTDYIGVEIVKLIVASEEKAKTIVENLFDLAQTNIESNTKQKDIIELVEKILVYKFTNYPLEELDKMFTLTDFKKTKFYRDTFSQGKAEGEIEGKIEGKIEAIPNLLRLGLPPEQIAEVLNLNLELVNQFIRGNPEEN
ncbi:Rpn family recombination-promoting nuclease/putative transposase [Cyanobacterium aponinum]|uniref:Rpn family recombination-promoting nuclease/putative transposase n=1 Tax=Cyanobacterium aponinum TaxID=379064 RepID=UPI000C12A981|nr:Rpn family recombination-promoting nuclease/putative transposase [Cyanobacterium aponinum]PHV64048.1 hypothetical protein CSQ80_02025 [Cyanobacterium aponinum IPPAS B-1201]